MKRIAGIDRQRVQARVYRQGHAAAAVWLHVRARWWFGLEVRWDPDIMGRKIMWTLFDESIGWLE